MRATRCDDGPDGSAVQGWTGGGPTKAWCPRETQGRQDESQANAWPRHGLLARCAHAYLPNREGCLER
jgi:hypothetical protein